MSLDSVVYNAQVLGEMTYRKGGIKSLDETLIAWANNPTMPYNISISGNYSASNYKYSKRAAGAYKLLTEDRGWNIKATELIEWEFVDPVVREKMFQVFGSEIITEIQADTITSMEGWFKDSDIVSFDEIGAFKNLTNLDNTFEGCSLLTSVGEIPKKVTSMKSTFVGAISIKKLYMSVVNPPVYKDTLLNTDLDVIYVPLMSLLIYKQAVGWANYKTIIKDTATETQ